MSADVATIERLTEEDGGSRTDQDGGGSRLAAMNYEDAAKKLIMYSRGVAKGSIGTAYGMSMGEDPVLEYLSRQEHGMNPSELADALGYTRPRMTRILDSLAAKGFVVREPDENDRRRVIVRCTDEGREHAKDNSSGGVSNLAKTLSGMGEHDVRELLRALETAYSLTYDKDNILGGSDDK